MTKTGAHCQVCQRPLPPGTRGRPPAYCSRACQARAYRARVADRAVEPAEPTRAPEGLSLDRIVRTAITLADRDGVAGLSMRRVAAELDTGAMSLYRYLPGKEELVDHMVDQVFAEHPLPEPGPAGWRAKLDLSAHQEWACYLAHPWLAPLVANTARPPIAANLMAYTDWRMRALAGEGLDFATMLRVAITVSAHPQHAALALAQETVAPQGKADSRADWAARRQRAVQAALAARPLPMVSRFGAESYQASEPSAVFEFGLARVLDGIAVLIEGTTRPR